MEQPGLTIVLQEEKRRLQEGDSIVKVHGGGTGGHNWGTAGGYSQWRHYSQESGGWRGGLGRRV